eukprot:TRINITY_DN14203_c0_g1_i1.p1 TRINITY_DN14203_c0_g1~~TRINITY_DN14203_c0_g1_i1.p1  ORF type:complete len:527 (-),score=62.51 TRINITY_DN14203_c0_g1_i1:478-2058(-)
MGRLNSVAVAWSGFLVLAFCHECGKDGLICVETSHHVVVLDAGSTGTRAHVYHYHHRAVSSDSYPLIEQPPLSTPEALASYSTHPGISSFADDPDAVNKTLGPLLRVAADGLQLHDPKAKLKRVPMYIGATAGLRLLPEETRDTVMRAVINFCRSPENPFYFRLDEQARVLGGEEEGAFGWLALNNFKRSVGADAKNTYGALDFGGASAQLTFIPEEPSILAGVFEMNFGQAVGGPIRLYSHSYLGAGMTASFQHATQSVVQHTTQNAVPTGVSEHIVDHPCLPLNATWRVYPGDFGVSVTHPSASRTEGPIVLRGSGSYDECLSAAKSIIPQTPCLQPPCSFAGVYQPALKNSSFVVFGALDEFKEWGVEPWIREGMPLLAALKKQMQRICRLPVQTQEELFGSYANSPPPCWKGVWLFAFLTEGLHFHEESKSLEIVEGCCDVAMGRAIYEVNNFPYTVRPSEREIRKEFMHTQNSSLPQPRSFPFAVAFEFCCVGIGIGLVMGCVLSGACLRTSAIGKEPLLG